MKAIVLFSGGLDSTVMLALALAAKRSCLALSFDYGQRHRIELEAAKSITRHFCVEHKILNIDHGAFANSSLVADMNMPLNRTLQQIDASPIPSTYVPARNTLFSLCDRSGRNFASPGNLLWPQRPRPQELCRLSSGICQSLSEFN